MKIIGSKPRPRVAVIGLPLSDEDRERLEKLFPSTDFYLSFEHLEREKSPSEIDLLIVGDKAKDSSNILYKINCISFSTSLPSMLGPENDSYIVLTAPVKTEEFIENEIILPYSRIREMEEWTNAKGWFLIGVKPVQTISRADLDILISVFLKSAIIKDSHSRYPFATVFLNAEQNIGVAWFPLPVIHKIDWIEAITNEWSKFLPETFPLIGNWARKEDWLLPEEINIVKKIKELEEQKKSFINKTNKEIADINKKYKKVVAENDLGLRKLLTEQGDELVNIVKKAFEILGFAVEQIDEKIEKGKPRIEDLRLTIIGIPGWEALAEVRGYSKSSGKQGDIIRLNKFSKLFHKEKGKLPEKIIYVVNGPIELSPPQRPKPFESNPDFLTSIADDDCLVVSTTQLYRVMQKLNKIDINDVSKSIIESTGEWKFVIPKY